jgi:hypothetical protein
VHEVWRPLKQVVLRTVSAGSEIWPLVFSLIIYSKLRIFGLFAVKASSTLSPVNLSFVEKRSAKIFDLAKLFSKGL